MSDHVSLTPEEIALEKRTNRISLSLGMLTALLSGLGWILHCKTLVYLGFVGLLAMVIVGGPHSLNIAGGILGFIVNAAVFFVVFKIIGLKSGGFRLGRSEKPSCDAEQKEVSS